MKRLALAIFVLALVVVSASFGLQTLNSSQPANVRTASPTLTSMASQSVATSLAATFFTRVSVGQSSAPSNQQAVSQSPSPVSSPLASPAGAYSSNLVSSSTASSNTRRLGFWIDERGVFSDLHWTSSQFVQNYFNTPPYPSAMIFATDAGFSYPQASSWLGAVATAADSMNAKIIILAFVNLSGQTINGVPDQTQQFTTFMNSLKGHVSIYGVEYEREYFGNTVAENQLFKNIVNNAGYTFIIDPTMERNFPNSPVLSYSMYPYFNILSSQIYTGISTSSIGEGFGETGIPINSAPVWTQTTVQNIVELSLKVPSSQRLFTLLYADQTSNLGWQVWSNPTLRSWIWSDPNYVNNYVLSTSASSGGGSPPPAPPSPSPVPSPSGSIKLSLIPANPRVNSWIRLTINGAPNMAALKVVITNLNTHKIVAILFPNHVSSTGSLSFSFLAGSTFLGSDSLSIYSMSSPSGSPIASLAFTVT